LGGATRLDSGRSTTDHAEMQPSARPHDAVVHDAYPHHADVGVQSAEGYTVLRAGLSPQLAAGTSTLIVAGDRVVIEPVAGVSEEELPRHGVDDLAWVVTGVRERRSKLSRPGHARHGGERFEQVIAANLDRLIIVAALARPPFHPRLVDRFLVAAERGEVPPMILLNKIDLARKAEAEAEAELGQLRQFDLPTLHASAKTGEGLEELLQTVHGKTVAFVGASGVGKTSIINAAFPDLALRVGRLQKGGRRGRHTTTRASLFRVDENDTCLIDTPGMQSFGIWGIEPDELHWYFPEFEPYWPDCKFNDCTHTHEVECAVKEAAVRGEIKKGRYASYVRLYESLREGR
jgi:ribosome biogenesis GTPase